MSDKYAIDKVLLLNNTLFKCLICRIISVQSKRSASIVHRTFHLKLTCNETIVRNNNDKIIFPRDK